MLESKWIPGYEGFYKVSNLGQIFSFHHSESGKQLKPFPNNRGYLIVCLKKYHTKKYRTVHRIVAESFIQCPGTLLEINHKDGIKTHNNIENLEWVTRHEQMLHAFRNGLATQGFGKWKRRLTFAQVESIRTRYLPGDKQNGGRALAREYGVDHRTVQHILARET
jgi:hypothetical protein